LSLSKARKILPLSFFDSDATKTFLSDISTASGAKYNIADIAPSVYQMKKLASSQIEEVKELISSNANVLARNSKISISFDHKLVPENYTSEMERDGLGVCITVTTYSGSRSHYLLCFLPVNDKRDCTTLDLVRKVLSDHGLLNLMNDNYISAVGDAQCRGVLKALTPYYGICKAHNSI
jgi:hypothetical protein